MKIYEKIFNKIRKIFIDAIDPVDFLVVEELFNGVDIEDCRSVVLAFGEFVASDEPDEAADESAEVVPTDAVLLAIGVVVASPSPFT